MVSPKPYVPSRSSAGGLPPVQPPSLPHSAIPATPRHPRESGDPEPPWWWACRTTRWRSSFGGLPPVQPTSQPRYVIPASLRHPHITPSSPRKRGPRAPLTVNLSTQGDAVRIEVLCRQCNPIPASLRHPHITPSSQHTPSSPRKRGPRAPGHGKPAEHRRWSSNRGGLHPAHSSFLRKRGSRAIRFQLGNVTQPPTAQRYSSLTPRLTRFGPNINLNHHG